MTSLNAASAAASSRFANVRTLAALAVLLVAAATIAGAWGFELLGHYVPCKLCLQERIPYYIGMPVALLAILASLMGGGDRLARILLLVLAGLFLWSAWQGVFHAGVEWDWWVGPSNCGVITGGGPGNANLLEELQTIRVVSCTDAPWRFPDATWGLSFAGWNAAISAGIALIALIGAAMRPRAVA